MAQSYGFFHGCLHQLTVSSGCFYGRRSSRTDQECNIGTPGYTGKANTAAITAGYDYLSERAGTGVFGSHTGTRSYRSDNSGIFVAATSTEVDWVWISGFVSDILTECPDAGGSINGQKSDSAGYVIVVAASDW
ncbi:hypothetical protein MMC22_004330 [Lobaria immixta]|nr:hypothetical protein [Lobaria immixta]